MNKPTPPLVSALIPVYNGAAFIAAGLDCILRQEHRPLEVIVVDDGSTDNTADIVKAYGTTVRYVYQTNQGCAAALNKALSLAQGEVVAFLDADDLWSDDKLALQLACLEKDPTLDMVAGRTQWIRENEQGGTDIHPIPTVFLSMSSTIMRRRAFEKAGSFDENLTLYGFDSDWVFRAKEAGVRLEILPETTLYYRRHDGNLTNDREKEQASFIASIKRSLDRRRSDGNPATPFGEWLKPGSELDQLQQKAKDGKI